jgi:phosphoglycerate dehydrogenase-like enzyme
MYPSRLAVLVEWEVVLTDARGVLDETIAEFVLGSVLAMAKDLPGTIRRQDRHKEHRPTQRVAGRSARSWVRRPSSRSWATMISS